MSTQTPGVLAAANQSALSSLYSLIGSHCISWLLSQDGFEEFWFDWTFDLLFAQSWEHWSQFQTAYVSAVWCQFGWPWACHRVSYWPQFRARTFPWFSQFLLATHQCPSAPQTILSSYLRQHSPELIDLQGAYSSPPLLCWLCPAASWTNSAAPHCMLSCHFRAVCSACTVAGSLAPFFDNLGQMYRPFQNTGI